MLNDRPSKRPYARIERERRFLLDQLPEGLDPGSFERLTDNYLTDTNLRLRRVEEPNGELITVKLGQKIPNPESPDDPRHRQMTTLYLQPQEGALFEALPGARSTKRRYKFPEQGWTFCIDVYERPEAVAGVMLCEVECDTDEELDRITQPTWTTGEITANPEYSGALLAQGQRPK